MRMSMTAFARGDGEFSGQPFSVEIKSVNHRYLDISPRLPEELRALEQAIREKCQEAMYRGKIECWVNLRRQPGEQELTLNPPLLKRWLLILSDSGVMESLGKPDWQTMLKLPGVMQVPTSDQQGLSKAVLEVVDDTMAHLLEMRAREGEQISETLLLQLDVLETVVAQVEAHLPEVEEKLRAGLTEKLAQLTLDTDSQRLEQEIVLLLAKADIREELDRLRFHVIETRKTLASDGAVGRRLDFLMQEFNREANTLGSKAADNRLSAASVDLKVIIEQMREQIQNLE